MDVRSLLNNDDDDECTSRPRIQRFGPFKPRQRTASQSLSPTQQQQQASLGHTLPPLPHSTSSAGNNSSSCRRPQLPSPSSRTSSYCSSISSSSSSSSSASSSSSCSSAQQQLHGLSLLPPPLTPSTPLSTLSPGSRALPSLPSISSCSEQLPPIVTKLPSLARSESGDSDSVHSPATPEPAPLRHHDSLSVPSKHFSYAARSLPRPQLLSHGSSSSSNTTAATASGPLSSMESFPHAAGHGFIGGGGGGDVAFAAPPMPVLPHQAYFNPAPPLPPPSEQQPETTQSPNLGSGSKPGQKKNSYPCPLARQFSCTEYFTTSGHAARHAKKHTGKKDAICPECNKAFTRKDNMEQHRRTHSKDSSATARSSSRAQSDKDDTRQRKMPKLQQQGKKQRPASMSAVTTTTPSTSLSTSNNINAISSPSVASTMSPSNDVPPPPTLSNSQSAPDQLTMDMALDPRLRDGSLRNSSTVPDFSPTQTRPFPTAFSVPNTPQNTFAPQFNPVMSSPPNHQQQFAFQQPHHHQQVNSMSMVPQIHTGMNNPMMSQSPQSAPLVESLDFMALGPLGLNVNIVPASNVDMGIPNGMTAMEVANNLSMSMNSPIGTRGPPMDMQNGLNVTPAMDRLALDKLAMAAEAASGDR